MTRALCGLLLALAFTLCGTTAIVHAPLPEATAFQPANTPADAPIAHPSVRMKVDAKVYRSRWSTAPAAPAAPVSSIQRPAPQAPTAHIEAARRHVTRLAAKATARTLTRLAERCATRRGAPVPYMV